MPRAARKQSSTGYYHVTNRGVGRMPVFFDAKDHEVFLECLLRAREVCDFKVLAYCIMTTHFHLVIKCDGPVPTSLFQSICARFASYYRKRHGWCGQIFQGRFHSEPIEEESHLLCAVRYVWRNPVSAHMCGHPTAYPWSSYLALGKHDDIIDDYLLLEFMSPEEWRRFAAETADDRLLEPFPRRMSDEGALELAHAALAEASEDDVELLSGESCPASFRRCLREGVTISQLARILGLARTRLYRAFRRWGRCHVGACSAQARSSP